MVDHLSPARRSLNMSRITSRDTRPEMIVRRLCHRMGYRFRLHNSKLPGKPDIVFRSRKAVIFVHGCFWHQHTGCRRATIPKSRPEYWMPKLQRNRDRDETNRAALISAGWNVLVVWECDTRDEGQLADTIRNFLGPPGRRTADLQKPPAAV